MASALSKGGTLRSGDLARPVAANPQVTAKILDGAVIVQMLSPRNSQTFEDYSKTELSSKMPSNWKSFLRVNDNKTELFSTENPQKQVFSKHRRQSTN